MFYLYMIYEQSVTSLNGLLAQMGILLTFRASKHRNVQGLSIAWIYFY